MSRLQKKCFIGSTGAHLLLAIILLVGPAFLSTRSTPMDVQVLDFVPDILIDADASGGGNRNAKPPPMSKPLAQPVAQDPPLPAVEKARDPDPPKQVTKPVKVDEDSLEVASPKQHKPQVSIKLVTKPNSNSTRKTNADTQATEKQMAAARQNLAKQFAQAAQRLHDGTSSPTTIEEYGPGGGGPTYASYAAWVKTVYENAWIAPEDAATDDAITKVTVTIASDGTVLSGRISRPSGDAPVDRSVQRTLERVTFVKPFPEGSKDKQRTFIINFNLKAKRGLA